MSLFSSPDVSGGSVSFCSCSLFQGLVLLYLWPPHLRSSVQPVLHDTNELLVGQLVVVIHVEDLEDGVDEVSRQLQPRSHVHSSNKLVCQRKTDKWSCVSSQEHCVLPGD